MEDRVLFAVSYVAGRTVGLETDIRHVPATVRARNSAEAEGLAMRAALKQYPKSDGWRNHSVMVCLASVEIRSEED